MVRANPIININTPAINPPSVNFRGDNIAVFKPNLGPNKDLFSTNPFSEDLFSKTDIEQTAKKNPVIMSILRENNIPLKVNIDELEKLKAGHLSDSRTFAARIYLALPANLKAQINLSDLQQAAMLHDYGKVLIPSKILNKKGALTKRERSIIELHSELGYELLKQKGINDNVLKLIKYHHQNPKGNGYPHTGKDFEYNYTSQVLNAADKYSALIEARSYKPALPREEALRIIKQDVDNGIISPEIYQALSRTS